MSYALRKPTAVWRNPFFVAVAFVHALGLLALLKWELARPESVIMQAISVRLLEPEAPKPAEMKPRIEPPKTTPKVAAPAPLPLLTAAPEAPAAPAALAVPPQPAAPVRAEPIAAPPAPPTLTAARFDADYLQNPKPAYPPMSRRLHEEGKVLLRVRVAADGSAQEVEVKQTSGFARLDAAAREAVSRWRFVPARRGADAVESWVAVPIVFSLEN